MNPSNWKLLEARRIRPGVGRILSVSNQKGGVGKTTTSVNLATALAMRGHRVLVVDIDPQSNATTGLGIDHRSVELSTYDLMMGAAPLEEVAVTTKIDGLWCAPASLDLAGAEIELVSTLAREHQLAHALAGATGNFEFVFVDCPPSLGLLTINAWVAARDLIVPVQCEYYALEGLGHLLGSAERLRKSLNPDLRIAGFVLTMYDARTKLSGQVAEDVRAHFGELVFNAVIPRSVRLSEAPSFGEPVLTLDPSSRGSISYRLLAAEVEERYGVSDENASGASTRVPEAAAGATVIDLAARERVVWTMPGPGGRGYGAVAPEPAGLDDAWPPLHPWGAS